MIMSRVISLSLIIFVLECESSKILCISPGFFGHLSAVVRLCKSLQKANHIRFGSHEIYRLLENGNKTQEYVTSNNLEYIQMAPAGPWNNVSHHRYDFASAEYVKGSLITNVFFLRRLLKEHFASLYNDYFSSTRTAISEWNPDLVIVESSLWGSIDACVVENVSFIMMGVVPLGTLDAALEASLASPAPLTSVGHLTSTGTRLPIKLYHHAMKKVFPLLFLDVVWPILKTRFTYGLSASSFSGMPLKAIAYISMSSWTCEYPRLLPPNFHLVGPILSGDSFHERVSLSKVKWLQSQSRNYENRGCDAEGVCNTVQDPENSLGSNKVSTTTLDDWLRRGCERNLVLVLIAFGTQASVNHISANAIIDGALGILEDVPGVMFLWSLPKDQIPLLRAANGSSADLQQKIHPRLWIQSWVQQIELLAMPSTVLFVSHCGLNSAYEALVHGVPIICLPFFADQPENAARLLDFGHAVDVLYHRELTAAGFKVSVATALRYDAIHAALSRADKTAEIIRTEGGLEKAASLVEFYLKFRPERRLLESPFTDGETQAIYAVFFAGIIAVCLIFNSIARWVARKQA